MTIRSETGTDFIFNNKMRNSMTTTNEIADKIAADNRLTKVPAKGIVDSV